MDSEVLEDILYNHRNLRLSARILGTIEAAFLLYIAFAEFREEIINHSPSPLVTMINGHYLLAGTLTITFIGLIIAFWSEGLGGGIALASSIVIFLGPSDFHVGYILGMTLFALPSVLYFSYWLSIYLALKKARQDQTSGR